jgi:hypothetical protein
MVRSDRGRDQFAGADIRIAQGPRRGPRSHPDRSRARLPFYRFGLFDRCAASAESNGTITAPVGSGDASPMGFVATTT